MHRIGYALPEGFQVMALGTQTVFELANLMMAEPFYAVDTYALDGSARASTGLTLGPSAHRAARPTPGWWPARCNRWPRRPRPSCCGCWTVRRARPARRRPVHGRFVLADAGLLDGRRATTHWYWADALQQRRPRRRSRPTIYIADGPVWTSAGMTAEIDLALALVERTWAPGGARGGAPPRHAPAPFGRPITTFGNAQAGAQVRPHPAGAGTCAAQPGATSASRNWPRRPS